MLVRMYTRPSLCIEASASSDPFSLANDLKLNCAPARERLFFLLPNHQRQHRTLHIQKDVLPYALC